MGSEKTINGELSTSQDVKIGFWIKDEKWLKLQLNKLAECNNTTFKHINIVKISHADDLNGCDAVIIKQKQSENGEDIPIGERIQSLPNLVQIDPILDADILSNRIKTFTKLSKLTQFLPNIEIMPSFTLERAEDLDKLTQHNSLIRFPFICKPNILCGADSDHEMLIIFNQNQLENLDPTELRKYFFQPLMRHRALLKTSFIGNEFFVAARPNINEMIDDGEQKTFNTFIVKTLCADKAIIDRSKQSLDEEMLTKMANVIGPAFNLSLYGVDLVVAENGVPYVIDLNIFPGYSEMISCKGIDYVHEAMIKLAIGKMNKESTT